MLLKCQNRTIKTIAEFGNVNVISGPAGVTSLQRERRTSSRENRSENRDAEPKANFSRSFAVAYFRW